MKFTCARQRARCVRDYTYDSLILTWSHITDLRTGVTLSGHFLFVTVLKPRDIVFGCSKCQKWILYKNGFVFFLEIFWNPSKFRRDRLIWIWNFPPKPPICLILLDLLDFPLHFLYKYKGNQSNRWFRGKFQIQINLSRRFFFGFKKCRKKSQLCLCRIHFWHLERPKTRSRGLSMVTNKKCPLSVTPVRRSVSG